MNPGMNFFVFDGQERLKKVGAEHFNLSGAGGH
jgi:hypothetical protein